MTRFWEKILFPPVLLNAEKINRKLKGKTVLITGASKGIGRAIAEQTASNNIHFILVARSIDLLKEVEATLLQKGATIQIIVADLREESDVDSIINQLSHVDIIISNAGKSIRRSLWDSLDRFTDIDRTAKVNYLGPTRLILGLLPKMKKNGVIINVSALNVLLNPAKKWAVYQGSKAAFDQWFRSIVPELKQRGVKGKSVYLPLVRTAMIAPTEHYKKYPAMSPEAVAKIIARLMVNKRSRYRPWWLPFVQFFDFFFGRIWWKTQ